MGTNYFKGLTVRQKAMDFVIWVYNLSMNLPRHEQFGIAGQLQRAAVSIASNIAEGSRRRGRKEFSNFCGFARGSAAEAETQLLIIQRIYPKTNTSPGLTEVTEIQKMLTALIRALAS